MADELEESIRNALSLPDSAFRTENIDQIDVRICDVPKEAAGEPQAVLDRLKSLFKVETPVELGLLGQNNPRLSKVQIEPKSDRPQGAGTGPEEGNGQTVALVFACEGSWDCCQEFFPAVSNIELTIWLQQEWPEVWTCATEFGGILNLQGAEFAVRVGLSSQLLQATLTGELTASSLLAFFKVDVPFDALKGLTLTHATLLADLKNEAYLLYFEVGTALTVKGVAGIAEFALQGLWLELQGGKDAASAGRIGGKTEITILGMPLSVSAEYSWSDAGSGWRFAGEATKAFSVGDVYQKAGGIPANLPTPLANLTCSNLDAVIDTITDTYSFAIDVTGSFAIVKDLELNEIGLSIERQGGNLTEAVLYGVFTIGDKVEVSLSAQYYDNCWAFQGNTGPGQRIPIGTLITELAEKFKTDAEVPAAIKSLIFTNLALSFNTGNKDFIFSGEAALEVDGKQIDITVAVALTRQDDGGYKKDFSGALTVGGADFALDFTSSGKEKVLKATWEKTDGKPGLDLKDLSNHGVPGLDDFGTLLRPKKATLTLNFGEKTRSLDLSCDLEQGAATVHIAKKDGDWIAAIGFEAPKISTESLGPLGSALRPHNIALDKLVVVAASADAPKDSPLTLGQQEYPVTKGLLLRGALEFEATSFSYPFECRLGGVEQPKALPPGDAGETAPAARVPTVASSGETPAAEEGKNNVTVGRTIGPVTFRKARLESRHKRLYVMLDASLGSGGFALDLTGFNLNVPLTLLQDPKEHAKEIAVGLDGLSISYSKPPLTISGGFARTKAEKPYVGDFYRGHLLIKAEAFQVTVLGSYGNILVNEEEKPSLFLFGAYAGVVGGPPAFFVTGLALGGGYNTQLALPPIDKVAEFPLVQAVTEPARFTNDALMKAVQPSYGDYWLAVGVKFTSFKLADSFALFSVSFGTRLQFALLGLTKLTMPVGVPANQCAVYAELAIRAVLDPEAGVFSIEGQLTQNSYVLARQFRLTGGFAFFVWFGYAPEAGDFVISLGGYHRAFLPPPHYPVVPRVGIHGRLSSALSITGEAYLALTPSCLMAGLKLEAVFHSGRIGAAFVAYADFIIAWAPFHYDAQIGIEIAVAVRLWRTFKVELSASLHVWGPPFAGRARVSYWIVSFTVAFGDTSGTKPPPLNWDEFQRAFLPSPHDAADHALLSTIRITEGLVREVKRGEGENEVMYRIVNPHELMIETDSAVPCTEVHVGKEERKYTRDIGIRPMGATKLTSRHVVNIQKDSSPVERIFKTVRWSQKNFPEALWSPSPACGKPEAGMLKGVPSGVVLRVQPKTPEHIVGPFLIEKFKYEPIPKQIPWSAAPPLPRPTEKKFSGVSADNPLRDQIRDRLAKWVAEPGKSSWNEIAMTNTSKNLNEHFQARPTCAALGQSI